MQPYARIARTRHTHTYTHTHSHTLAFILYWQGRQRGDRDRDENRVRTEWERERERAGGDGFRKRRRKRRRKNPTEPTWAYYINILRAPISQDTGTCDSTTLKIGFSFPATSAPSPPPKTDSANVLVTDQNIKKKLLFSLFHYRTLLLLYANKRRLGYKSRSPGRRIRSVFGRYPAFNARALSV